MKFERPPTVLSYSGRTRRVGFELEFGGISLVETCDIITGLFGGRTEQINIFCYKVHNTLYGEFSVEADAHFLSEKRYEKFFHDPQSGMGKVVKGMEKFISDKVAGKFLPFEIAMPPLAIDNLEPADQLREKLYQHAASGTRSSVFAAFGTQINPELPDFKAETLVNIERAFFLLSSWLMKEANVSLARQVAPFIHPFPQEYIDVVLDLDYKPNLEQFFRDYLTFNPTRNRPLDFLPLLAFLDKELLEEYPVEIKLVKARPTLHYRLPNSEIDDPSWSLAQEWNRWVKVENLAFDQRELQRLCESYMILKKNHVIFPRSMWTSLLKEWMNEGP